MRNHNDQPDHQMAHGYHPLDYFAEAAYVAFVVAVVDVTYQLLHLAAARADDERCV